jgi:hypothetical protein
MIKDQDVSALDKLIDFYGEYLSVRFRELDLDLGDLREFLIDNNISLSIDVYNVNRNGIFDIDNNQIVKITGLDIFNKDDLIKI